MSGCAPTSAASQAEAWRHYMPENIPPQFGSIFNTGSWNQGFVVADRHMFLLERIHFRTSAIDAV